MRIAVVHDDLVQWGGAERVLEAICELYPDAPIFTSVFDKDNKQLATRFSERQIFTSFLQKIPGWRTFYKAFLPFYSMAFEQFDFSDYDLVISQTTRFAKSVITKPGTTHICYCHTPPRFLWHFSGEKHSWILNILMSKLRILDQVSARRVDYFLAGSKNAQNRIKKIYHTDSRVVYPFVDLERFSKVEGYDGGYFVVISRLNSYKRVDLAVRACKELNLPLKIIGSGSELTKLKEIVVKNKKIEFLGSLSDEVVAQVISGAKALIICGEEDFGLTPLEAQALGKPVIAYKAGGALETVIEGKTGIFFEEQTVESLKNSFQKFDRIKFSSEDCKQNAAKFSKEIFIKEFKKQIDSLVN